MSFFGTYPSGGGGGSFSAGNLTAAGTDGIVITGGSSAINGSGTSVAQHVADSTHNGYLSSTDWSTFNGKAPTASPTFTGSVKFGNYHMEPSCGSVITSPTGSGGSDSQTIDWSTASFQRLALTGTGTSTLTFTNMVAGAAYTLEVTNAATAVINWPAAVVWPSNLAPTLSTGGTLYDQISFVVRADGTYYRGSYSLGYPN